METNRWKDIDTCPAAAEKQDARKILVWHIMQGAVVSDTFQARDNKFNAYWRELPYEWVDPNDRLPGKGDADSLNCVLLIDKFGELRMTGWHQVKTDNARRWSPAPEPPADAAELRHSFLNRRKP